MKPDHRMIEEARKKLNKDWIKQAKAAKIPKEIIDKVKVRGENK